MNTLTSKVATGIWAAFSLCLAAIAAMIWQEWSAQASTIAMLASDRSIIAGVAKAYGTSAAGFVLPCPKALITYFAVINAFIVAIAPVFACALRPKELATSPSRYWIDRALVAGVFCGLTLLGYVWVARSTVSSSELTRIQPVAEWTLSLWWRTSAFSLPFLAIGLAAWRPKRAPARWAICIGLMTLLSMLMASIYVLAPGARELLPYRVDRLLLSFDAMSVAKGCVLILLWAAVPTVLSTLELAKREGPMRRVFVQKAITALLATFVVASAAPAHAYNRDSHVVMTNAAWQIMRAASATNTTGPSTELKDPGPCATSPSLCGATVTQTQWDDFLSDIELARRVIGSKSSEVPNGTRKHNQTGGMEGDPCFVGDESTPAVAFPSYVDARHFWRADQDDTGEECGTGPAYTPVGLYAGLSVELDGVGNQGTVLGWHAKHRDDDLGETRIQWSPAVGAILDLQSDYFYEFVFGQTVFVPVLCAFLSIFEISDCESAVREFANDIDPFDALKGLIPGWNMERSEDTVGFWHHINVRSDEDLPHFFDDKPGYAPAWAGPDGDMGAIDEALTVASQLIWITLDAGESSGDDRYQITSNVDGHEPTEYRDDDEWREDSVGDTQFSPLDNLAYYGAHDTTRPFIERIGWPLHAIGDATVPQHVVGTGGHGHAPYEAWVDRELDALTWLKCPARILGCNPSTNLVDLQTDQAHRVLQVAYRWRQYLLTHGVQDFITALAEETLAMVGDTEDAWPFCDECSSFMALNGDDIYADLLDVVVPTVNIEEGLATEDLLNNPVSYYDNKEELIRPMVERAMGAKIAFLLWAVDGIGQCIDSEGFGCLVSADCCDSGQICTTDHICGDP